MLCVNKFINTSIYISLIIYNVYLTNKMVEWVKTAQLFRAIIGDIDTCIWLDLSVRFCQLLNQASMTCLVSKDLSLVILMVILMKEHLSGWNSSASQSSTSSNSKLEGLLGVFQSFSAVRVRYI